ncbi:MAG: ribosome hibernation-promoting factor, HPF/YfiA family [Actinomycetota bacterium]
MDLTLKGRGVRITEQFRSKVDHKLSKLERLHPRLERLEIEISSENTPKLNGTKRLDATLVLPRHTVRATASAPDIDAGLDLLVERLERQVRDYREKRKKRFPLGVNRLKSPRIGPGGRGKEE